MLDLALELARMLLFLFELLLQRAHRVLQLAFLLRVLALRALKLVHLACEGLLQRGQLLITRDRQR